MNGPTRDRLESLLSALIDERLSEDQIEELNFLLRDDPENRRFYLHYMDIQSRLSIDPDESTTTMDWRGILSELARSAQGRSATVTPPARTTNRWATSLPWLLATVATAACFWMAVFYSGSRPEGAKELNASTPAQAPTEASVRLVSSAGAELFNERLPAIGGSFEYGREYTLVEGMMSIEFPCGAEAILEAPSIIQIADPMRLVVKIGECSVHAPDGAEGFRVDTPQNSIRDLGTRFSVSVGDNGTAEVQVIEGAAEVSSLELDRATLASELMTEHEAVRIGGKSMDRLEFDPEEYRYSLPDRVIGYDVEGTSTDGSQDTILQSISVQRGGRVIRYEAEQLIQPKLTHFRGIGGVPHLCFTSESEGRPSIDFHESDHALTTGWINPGGSVKGLTSSPVLGDSNQLGTPGFAVQFDGGVRNGPGPDVVLFELQSLIELPSGDVFHVSPLVFNDNLRTHTVRRFDVTTKTPGVTTVAPIWVAKRGTLPPNKSELAMISGECFQPTRSFVALVVGIDLSDLGYTEGELVESLFFQDAQDDSFGFDPTLIGGLPALDR